MKEQKCSNDGLLDKNILFVKNCGISKLSYLKATLAAKLAMK